MSVNTPALVRLKFMTHVAALPDDVEKTGSGLDAWWARVLSTPSRLRWWFWGGPSLVVLLAAVLRLWDLGLPHTLVFDETFYVKDAWSLWNNGFETAWPDKADQSFVAGNTTIFLDSASFVVHPPLGKWLIGLGMWLVGPANSFGWRITVAIAGLVIVWLVMLIARRLTGSTLVAVLTGGLMAIDGLAIQLSRVTLLDGILAALTLTGVYLVLVDRQTTPRLLAERVSAARAEGHDPMWGPTLWRRPWLILAGVTFGLSAGVKWSGLYFLVALCLYVVIMNAFDRRRLGLHAWLPSTVLRSTVVTFVLTVPAAIVAYLSTWIGWIVTSGGYDRTWADSFVDARWAGALSWVPLWFQNLWHFHTEIYNFHVNLAAAHPYAASPLTWLFLIRPTSMYYAGTTAGQDGCGFDSCAAAISGLPNPLIWWAGTAAVFYLLYRLIRYRTWQPGFVLVGMVAGFLPWLMYLNRTVFFFYGIVYEPYMILAIGYCIFLALGSRDAPRYRRLAGIRWVAVFGIAAVAISLFFYPVWTGMQIPFWYWQAHMWLPSWV